MGRFQSFRRCLTTIALKILISSPKPLTHKSYKKPYNNERLEFLGEPGFRFNSWRVSFSKNFLMKMRVYYLKLEPLL